MFRDIVSNLSFSPAANSQLTYYWRRLRRESLTRQLSMAMAGALVFVQVAAIIAPPDPANAASPNNIVLNGIGGAGHPQKTIVNLYLDNSEIKGIFNYFGITKADLENTHHATINSSNHSLKSLGREQKFDGESVKVIGGKKYYLRSLYKWADNYPYDALEGKRKVDGKYFAVLINCGNIVVIDSTPDVKPPAPVKKTTPTPPPVTPPPTPSGTPNIAIAKTGIIRAADGTTRNANGGTAQPGEIIEYTLTTKNTGTAAKADYVVEENLNDVLEYSDIVSSGSGVLVNGLLTWPKTTIAAGQSYISTFQVRVKNPLPATPKSISDGQSFDLKMNNVYGNLVQVNLAVTEAPVSKQVEVATETLPQTGAGTNLLVLFVTVAGITYFYFRNRQLIKETGLLRADHGHGGSV